MPTPPPQKSLVWNIRIVENIIIIVGLNLLRLGSLMFHVLKSMNLLDFVITYMYILPRTCICTYV